MEWETISDQQDRRQINNNRSTRPHAHDEALALLTQLINHELSNDMLKQSVALLCGKLHQYMRSSIE